MAMPSPSPKGFEAGSRASVPIDLGHLRRFTLGDRELEQEILGLFIEQAPATIERLLQAGSHREWQRAAHTLKGSARAVGAWQIADLAEHAELMDGFADKQACDRLLGSLRDAVEEARSHITSLGTNN